MLRKRVWIPAVGVIVVGALVVGNLVQRKPRGREVEVEALTRRSLENWVRAPGIVEPVTAVDISSNVTGRVARIHVHEGQSVKQGDLLLTLDDTRLRSTVDQYGAMLRAAQSQIVLSEAQDELARQILSRREDLFTGGLLSSEELESARVEARVRAAQVIAQREELERLRAALEEARRNLQETQFYAPIAGVVTALNLEEGENVIIGTMNSPGTVILTLADLARMEVEARVSESDLVLVRPSQRARVLVDAMPDSTLEGTVTSVGESGARSSRDEGAEFEVHVGLLAGPAWLKTGMSADVEILVAQADSVPSIPIQALVARSEETVREWEQTAATGRKARVKKAEPERDEPVADEPERGQPKLVEGVFAVRDGLAHFVRVESGVRGESWLQVTCSLEPGAMIVSGPYRVLRHLEDGQAVKTRAQSADEERAR